MNTEITTRLSPGASIGLTGKLSSRFDSLVRQGSPKPECSQEDAEARGRSEPFEEDFMLEENALDRLTGLPGRAFVMTQLRRLLEEGQPSPAVFLVGMQDLDEIGATFGDEVAEVAIRTLGKILDNLTAGPSAWAARISSGRFLVLRSDARDGDELSGFAKRILEACDETSLRTSVGIAWQPGAAGRPLSFLLQAEEALSTARGRGGRTYAWGCPLSEPPRGETSNSWFRVGS